MEGLKTEGKWWKGFVFKSELVRVLFVLLCLFNFVFVLLWYVRQLCGRQAKVSLVQISRQLQPPRWVEGAGEGHFRGGGEAVFGLAPGTGLEGERTKN